jgi:hypothetical protein
MEENIMTTTEEIVETVEDIAIVEPGKKVGIGLAFGAAVVGIGMLAYKIGKKCKAKIEAKKAQKAAEAEANFTVVECNSEDSDEE